MIDINSIPNEVLVMNAAEWIGKMKDGDYTAYAEDNNQWTGKGIRQVHKSEIQGHALSYLSLLEIRASTNINLINTVDRLRSDYSRYEKRLSKKLKVALGIGIWWAILILILIAFLKWH